MFGAFFFGQPYFGQGYPINLEIGATLPAIQSRVPMPMLRVPDQDRIMRMHGRTLGS